MMAQYFLEGDGEMSTRNTGPTNGMLGYPADARLLFVNADDFGMCHAVNEAIIRSHEQALQVRAVDGGARCPDSPLQFGRGDAREHLPTPRAYLPSRGGRAQACYRFGEAELSQRLLGVGGEQQAGAGVP
jgi:hypothetical protein